MTKNRFILVIIIQLLITHFFSQETNCNDGLDNDNDQLIDYFDPDCDCNLINQNNYYYKCGLTPCTYTPPSGIGVNLKWQSSTNTDSGRTTPLVADLNNDGVTEVIVRGTNRIVIYDGLTGNVIETINTAAMNVDMSTVAIADVDLDGRAEIFTVVTTSGGQIVCYKYNGTNYIVDWTTNITGVVYPHLSIVDFNNDGIPEVLAANIVLNSQTGLIYASGTGSYGRSINSTFTVAADVLPNGACANCQGLEIIAGNQVYSVNIDLITPTNSSVDIEINLTTELDGRASIADVDRDGDLDAVITSWINNGAQDNVYVWDLQTPTLLAPKLNGPYRGQANIGDFNGDGVIDFGIVGQNRYTVLSFNTAGLTQLWQINTNDGSAITGSTLFDFDADGSQELVYRDETTFRILNGATGVNIIAIPCPSSTRNDYPVVADVDDDGESEIVVTSSSQIRIYESDGTSTWSPSRNVWNQHNYFNVNINDDLTVPIQQQDHGIIEDSLKMNNFLTQYSNPVFVLPNASLNNFSNISCNGDTVEFTFDICNDDALIQSGFPVSSYIGNPFLLGASYVETKFTSIDLVDIACEELVFKIHQDDMTDSIYFLANDSGNNSLPLLVSSFPYAGIQECNYLDNSLTYYHKIEYEPFSRSPVCLGDGNGRIDILSADDYSYSIDGGSPVVDTFFLNLIPGAYLLEVINNVGCIRDTNIEITGADTINSLFSFIDSCEYFEVEYVDLSNATGLATITSWSWDVDNDGVEDYNIQNPSHLFSAGSHTTKLTVTSDLGCTKDTMMEVTVHPSPTANFTFQSECLYDSLLFVDASTVLGDLITSHAWNFGETNLPPVQSITATPYYTYSSSGSYTVSKTSGTANGCYDTISQTVEAYEVPIASFTTTNVCQDITAEFTDQSTIGTGTIDTYDWNFGDISTGNNQNETHDYASDGTYTIEFIVTSDNSCKDTTTQSLIIYPMPVAAFTTQDDCLEETIPFTDNSTINSPGVITQWAWDFGDQSNPSSNQSPSHLYQDAGTYDVTLSVTSIENCSNSTQQSVTIHPLPQVSFLATENCVNEPPTIFTNTSVISNGTNIGFAWSFGDVNSSTSIQENPNFEYGQHGDYEVILGVLSDQGCTSTKIDTIKVKHKPRASFTQDTTGGCAPMCVNFISESEDSIGIATWNWQFENSLGEGSNKFEGYCYEEAGSYDVKLIVENTVGCNDTIETIGLINTFSFPIAAFELTPEVTTVDESTISFTNESVDEVTWKWDFADGRLDSTSYEPEHTYADTGSYIVELVAFSANGCSTTAYHEVIILPIENVFVPTAFSPNGDGENDALYVRGYLKGLYFSVYDRWGKKVFETTNPENGWDGSINGKPAMEGVYMWYLQTSFNGEPKKFKGDVSLMR